MSDETTDSADELPEDTPASPHPDSPHRHGDALLEGSGSRHGEPPDKSAVNDDSAS